jgi:tRNA-splicing ligase RtcB
MKGKKENTMPVLGTIKGTHTDAKIWAAVSEVESGALDQIRNIASLPWVFKHVAIMGDCHYGNGATVGSVIAMKDAVAPAAVGVDLGCGMGAIRTNLKDTDLPQNLHKLRMDIEAAIPVGFNAHEDTSKFVKTEGAELWKSFPTLHERVQDRMTKAMRQCGTLGGGNHFISLDCDQDNNIWMLLHSGSRNIGKELAESHIWVAKTLDHNKYIVDRDLSVFLAGTPEFKAYRRDLFWAQEYAFLNRKSMFELYKGVMVEHFPQIKFEEPILCHHNYVAEEIHFGESTFVTRKGAINAEIGKMGIIPGSIATGSYIVEGLGNPESFNSASHGAGRKMSRGAAKKAFTIEDVKNQTSGVECRKDIGMADELPQAYKDIETVMANQQDLVSIKHKLMSLMTIKG